MNSKNKKIVISIGAIAIALAIIFACVYFFKVLPDKKAQEEWARQVREYYDNKIQLYESENLILGDNQTDIAFIGDSLTDAYDVKSYYPEYTVTNRGIGGDTTFGVEERLKVSLFDIKPKVVVMLIGANNMDTMFDNYENIFNNSFLFF